MNSRFYFTLLVVALAGSVVSQSETTECLNFASWSSHMSEFPLETYCPETASNPLESEYEDCRSTAWDLVYSCPGGQDDSDKRTSCICSSIIMMSSCLTAYCPSNSVQASVISQDKDDYTSIFGCPTLLGATAGGGGGSGPTPTGSSGGGATDAASPSENVGAGGPGMSVGGGRMDGLVGTCCWGVCGCCSSGPVMAHTSLVVC